MDKSARTQELKDNIIPDMSIGGHNQVIWTNFFGLI